MSKTIGLALGSGGLKGLAHVGVIKVLEKNKIKISHIAGTSMGALVGAYYALYQNAVDLEMVALGGKWDKFLSLLAPTFKLGFVKGEKVEKLLNIWFGNKEFKDTKIPLRIIATDLVTGKEVVFSKGKIADAVRASVSIPMFFQPVKNSTQLLVDGGLCQPVPVKAVRDAGAKFVVAVNLDNYQVNKWFKPNQASLASITIRSFDIVRHYLGHCSSAAADMIVEPRFNDNDLTVWKKYFISNTGKDSVLEGERAMKKQIKKLL
ncbi:MAG: Patatin [Candidatus Magasanikbacteria bacterium GW2011_GWA2_37_8]|uniref:Patatin n=1 Tax=Candidatus Magasanikbacteria bacterium GW2011_GWA2_37_8 TaxID=1619036 RepID=A0A0G0JV78_9BACT|nr:MAG: Patatin [Candidatus Magasanikbacteria bacterium GW2011_GWA2_37_8]